jgi:hypothetical protein
MRGVHRERFEELVYHQGDSIRYTKELALDRRE